MSKEVISEIATRDAFFLLLQNNPGLIILRLSAKWCGPCKLIEKPVHAFFATSPPEVICGDIDVDKSFDFYSFLKSKKMVNGIPVLLCFKKDNSTYIPDDMVTGADPNQLHQFFVRCGKHLMDALTQHPNKTGKK
jgi:thiol:disulfide interchange protein